MGKVISLNEALRRVQSKDHILGYVNTTPLALTKEQAEDVKTLSEMLRNNFEHFMPMGWSIEISGMPDLLKSVSDIIEHLAFKTGTVFWEEHQADAIRKLIGELKQKPNGTAHPDSKI